MIEKAIQEVRPALPSGTYQLTALLIGALGSVRGATVRLVCQGPLLPEQLGNLAQSQASNLVPDDLAGVQPGMWWLFNVHVMDAWGRQALMWEQSPIDRTLSQEDLAGEIGRICPDVFSLLGDSLIKLLGARPKPSHEAGWPSASARN